MPPNVTQSFKLRSDLESFATKSMLRVFIAEHCYTVEKHAII